MTDVSIRSFSLPMAAIFEQGTGAYDVRLSAAGAVVLYDRVLCEDDGPGIGSGSERLDEDERSPAITLAGTTRLRKLLLVEHPEAVAVTLCLRKGVLAAINGRLVSQSPAASDAIPVPPGMLRRGLNEIDLVAPPEASIPIKLARRRHILANAPERTADPPRSFRSADDGASWEPLDGELGIRLQLVQHVPRGSLLSPIIDLAGEGPQWDCVLRAVRVRSIADLPAGTRLSLLVRTGTSPLPEAGAWSAWGAADAVPAGPCRFAQWQAVLETDDATRTPALREVVFEASIDAQQADAPPPSWAQRLRLAEMCNPQVRWTSMPFRYEDPSSPRLRALRERFNLDAVVAAGRTGFERLVLLRDWVSKAWVYKPPAGRYPPWDAEAIIAGQQGFCVQYAIVYLQCAIALGHQARFLFGHAFGTGHEVVEVWSDEHAKWVYMDPNHNICHFDPVSGQPLSMLEVRDAILATYYGDGTVIGPQSTLRQKNAALDLRTSPRFATAYEREFRPVAPRPLRRSDGDPEAWGGRDGAYFVPPYRWIALHYLPRNDFLAQPIPLPRTQGVSEWEYPDYWVWDDGRNRTQPRHRRFTARRSDLDWTLNTVRFALTYGREERTLIVRLSDCMPYRGCYLASFDGGAWAPCDQVFTWRLHDGLNRLEVRARNTVGVLGPVSAVALDL